MVKWNLSPYQKGNQPDKIFFVMDLQASPSKMILLYHI